jgi:hypothetical protein
MFRFLIICAANLVIVYSRTLYSQQRPQILWYSAISHNQDIDGRISPLIYKNGILCLGRDQNGPFLQTKEQTTGKNLWIWRDSIWQTKTSIRVYSY